MLNFGFFRSRRKEAVIDFEGIRFPEAVLHVLLAQSASAEVRRRYEGEGDVFRTILVDKTFQRDFIGSYLQANVGFFDAIAAQVPTDCRRILDIGCGIGLIDLLLYRRQVSQGSNRPMLYLFDKSVDAASLAKGGIAPTGFNDRYVFTASLALTARFLQLNGVAEQDIRLCEVGAWNIRDGAPFDVVFSRKSWGFHYPLAEYLDEVRDSLSPSGVAITDVRGGQGGEALMDTCFNDVRVLQDGRKSALIMAREPVRGAV